MSELVDAESVNTASTSSDIMHDEDEERRLTSPRVVLRTYAAFRAPHTRIHSVYHSPYYRAWVRYTGFTSAIRSCLSQVVLPLANKI